MADRPQHCVSRLAWAGSSLLSLAIYGLGMLLSGSMVSGFLQVALRLDYGSFGFIKRGLIGSLAQPLLPDPLAYDALIQAGRGYGLLIGLLLSGVVGLLLAHGRQGSSRLLFLLSPATMLQLGYTFSWYDGACTLLFLLQLLLLHSRRAWLAPLRAPLLAALAAAALLVHELDLLAFLPLLLAQAWPRLRPAGRGLVVVVVLVTTTALLCWGSYEAGPVALAAGLGLTADQAPLEFTSSLAANAAMPLGLALSPLLLSLIGVDLPRWCGLAATNLLLLGLLGVIRFHRAGSRSWVWLPLPFVLAGPIGVFGYSFPLLTPGLSSILKTLPALLR